MLKICRLFRRLKKKEEVLKPEELVIKAIHLVPNPRFQGNLWKQRSEYDIDKVIIHQELGDGDTISVNNYHTNPDSHINPGIGAPKICYHYTIEKDGTVYKVNDHKDIVWHCKGQNQSSIGIMLCGNFDGPTHEGTSIGPTDNQVKYLKMLLEKLKIDLQLTNKDFYGHCDFGKKNCPGTSLYKFIEDYKNA